jgi:protein-tyrosine phosphatase
MGLFQRKPQRRPVAPRLAEPARPIVSDAARRLLRPTDGERERPLRVLMVCTANVSRSPLAAALLARTAEIRNLPMEVSSAGARATQLIVDEEAQAAGAALGVRYPDHRPRLLTEEIIANDGGDLILAMAREHAREVVMIDPMAMHRTFTLKELVRRADALGRIPHDLVTLDSWQAALTADRDQRDLLGSDTGDDVTDPFGRSSTLHRQIAEELDDLIRRLGGHLSHVVAESAVHHTNRSDLDD